ncbi:MAG: O-methyltransferase [Lachnospiraceae bacterium]|nr:O-methyltransferase [Lachnospiraceae bacterium]
MTDGFSVFVDAMEPDQTALLREAEEEAERDHVPIIRRESAAYLETLLRIRKPEKILEIGSGIGYSALRMAAACPKAAITTIELDAERAARAEAYFARANETARIRLIRGDAGVILPQLSEKYDFIFLDGPKGQYEHFRSELDRLLKEGGVLLADNILQEGRLLESRYAVPRRERTIHGRMRRFVREMYRDSAYRCCLLPVGDGMLTAVKREKDNDGLLQKT